MDDDLGSYDRSSYRNFGPKLRPMPEAQRASDPDMEEVQEYLDTLRVASNHSNRFSSFVGDALCQCPRRKSSSSYLDYRSATQGSVNSYFRRESASLDDQVVEEKDDASCKPWQEGDVEAYDPFATCLEEGDELLPLNCMPRKRTSNRSSTTGSQYSYGVGMSSISLDLDDVFGESDSPISASAAVSPPVDTSPQVARRRSSITYTSSTDRSTKLLTVNLMADTSKHSDNSKHLPEDSGDICLAGSDRFQTRCPKEKSFSMSKPTRRISAYTLDLRPVTFATIMQS